MSITLSVLSLYERYARGSPASGVAGLGQAELDRLIAKLAPALTQLEALRQRTMHTIDQRVTWIVPGAALAGLALDWGTSRHRGSLTYLGAFVVLAWGFAFTQPYNAYRRAYKNKILPDVAACFGQLSYRKAQEPDLARLSALSVIPHFNFREVEDEIFGNYRGVPLRIVEVKLSVKTKQQKRVVFNGLLIDLELSGRSAGRTVVVRDLGRLSNAVHAVLQRAEFRRVRLEDPRFEEMFEIYGTDQIGARALLTPAVMERLTDIGRGGAVPCLLAENGVVQVALRRDRSEDHFEPPSITGAINAGEHLARIAADIAFVLGIADALVEMQGIRRASGEELA